MESKIKYVNEKIETKLADNQELVLSANITVVGRHECGKTTLSCRLEKTDFKEAFPTTPIGNMNISFHRNNQEFILRIFDTSGQESYSRFRDLTFSTSEYIIVCYSITDTESFIEVSETLHDMIKQKALKTAKVILCATKKDMRGEGNTISTEEGIDLAKTINAYRFFECSGVTDEGVEELRKFLMDDFYYTKFPKELETGTFDWIKEILCCSKKTQEMNTDGDWRSFTSETHK